jgi:hypothetical protein
VLRSRTPFRFCTLLVAAVVLAIVCGSSSAASGGVVLTPVGADVISKHGLLDISTSGDRAWVATIAPHGDTNLWEVRERKLQRVELRLRVDHVVAATAGVWVISSDQGASRLSVRYLAAGKGNEPRLVFSGVCAFNGALPLGAQLWVVCGRTLITLSSDRRGFERRVQGIRFSTIVKAGSGIWLVQRDGLRGIGGGARGFIKLPRVDRSTWSGSGATVWRVVLGASRISHIFRIDVRKRTFRRYTLRGPFAIDEVTQVGRELWGTNLVSKRIIRYRLPSPHQPIGSLLTGRTRSGEVDVVPSRTGAWIVSRTDGEQRLYRATLQ